MQNLPAAPVLRSPQSLLRELRRTAACIEVTVALVVVFSICALLYAITQEVTIASWTVGTLV